MPLTDDDRRDHVDWLLQLTSLPTAAGREGRVERWIRRWCDERPDVTLTRDGARNLVVSRSPAPDPTAPPIYITAHMDHPAFVVERIIGPATVEVSFRGGVMDVFFEEAPVRLVTRDDRRLDATLAECTNPDHPIAKSYLAELENEETDALQVGDVGVWSLPESSIDNANILHTAACDDLAAVAAALAAFDRLRALHGSGERIEDVRLLFTRAEEIGFIGAIAACRLATIPSGARVVALENSRSFADSPIGGGPILRVGDRISTFTPALTAAIAKRAEETTGRPAIPTASQREADLSARRWQRKLMAGGACEASVFCAFGYDATCLCLPLGNYHNMAHLAEIQAGEYDASKLGPPRAAREFISVDDFNGLVELLVAIGTRLPAADPFISRIDDLYAQRSFILDDHDEA